MDKTSPVVDQSCNYCYFQYYNIRLLSYLLSERYYMLVSRTNNIANCSTIVSNFAAAIVITSDATHEVIITSRRAGTMLANISTTPSNMFLASTMSTANTTTDTITITRSVTLMISTIVVVVYDG